MGTRGGDVQPQLVAQLAARTVLGGVALDEAQASPRWTVTEFAPGSPSHLVLEPGVPARVTAGLEARGHHIEVRAQPQPGWGPMSIIGLDGEQRRAAADPRVDTTAALLF
jgi:gamma-glutamyltranspeptidase/glutathione hydrolase